MAGSPLAAAAGVRPGMRIGGARALCARLGVRDWDQHRNDQLVAGVAIALLQFSPEVATPDGDVVLVDVSASLKLFGGPRKLTSRIREVVRAMGIEAVLASGPTAAGARLLAAATQPRGRRAIGFQTLARRLDALPCRSLPEAAKHAPWLTSIGCDRLGQLRALPRAALQRRTTVHLLAALDAAYGVAPEAHSWVSPPPEFSARLELPESVEHVAAAEYAINRLVHQLCGWLTAQHLATTRLVLTLEHERGRKARQPTEVDVRLGAAASAAGHLQALIKERVHRLALPAPVVALGLIAPDLEPQEAPTLELFPQPGGTPADRQAILDMLVARLGRENVLHPSPVADHRPHVADHWVPLDVPTAPWRPAYPSRRPIWMLEQPISLPTRSHRPFYGAPLQIVQGPERIEDGWWDELVIRDYFVAVDPEGARYWLYRERGVDGGWFLQGLFG